jgi:hypothetical protein
MHLGERGVGWGIVVGLLVGGGATLAACGSSVETGPAETAGTRGGTTGSGGASTTTSAAGGASTGTGGGATGVGGHGGATGVGGQAGQAGQGGAAPPPTPCTGHPLEIVCAADTSYTCDAQAGIAAKQDCGAGVCEDKVGCVVCLAGQNSCRGSELRACDANAFPAEWVTVATCDPATEVCNAKTGACQPLAPIGGTNPTGVYFKYARFTAANSPFKGGYDIDSYGDLLYVNRDTGGKLDVYKVELVDSDGDGKLEPNQHPDNPDAPGPIEERVLTFVQTYDIPELGPPNSAELFASADRVNWVVGYPAKKAELWEYVFAKGVATKIADAPPPLSGMAFLGRDETTGVWYSGVHYERVVYSYDEVTKAWVPEFKYPDLAGDHMDGMEVVTDPNTGVTYVYVSDMTSDYLGQYVKAPGGEWIQQNLFKYDGIGDMVEGMGFGAFDHFWISGYPEQSIYEIGGGDLSQFTHH